MTDRPPDPVYFLLVDDLEENLLALEAVLRRTGLVLLRARSGTEALELLLQYPIALALIDIRMPGMDGFELAELMRGSARTRRVPIIFLTAAAEDKQRRFRGYETGAVDFLHKPIETDILRSKAEVFFELARERMEVARQRDELESATAEISRLLEQSQRAAETLRDADKRKDEFLATLAHELRNPLAPIRHCLQLLRLTQGEGPDAEYAHRVIERQVSHMTRLIEDLLDVSRVSRGVIELRREKVDVAAAARSAMEDCRNLIESRRHALELEISSEPMLVEADAVRLAQILSNLLTNAAKYTEPGGTIRFCARRVESQVEITVSDTGVGIAAEMLPMVWDLFGQVRDTMEKSQGGLGIGLTIVRRLVEMHGGEVAVNSEGLGKGSAFTVLLPLADTSPLPAEFAPDPFEDLGGGASRRILVLDDNVDAAKSLALLLKLSGHETAVSHDGPSALEQAKSFKPQIVFLDIGLPGMDGYEVARKLREDASTAAMTLVALTGWGSDADKQKSREAGVDYHVTKPIDLKTVTRILGETRS